MKFENKCALVTGAAAGMGAAIAEKLASEGARVLAIDLPGKERDDYVHRDRITGLGADLSKIESIPAISDAIHERLGRLDILVNNAGIVGDSAEDGFGSRENLRKVMAINFEAVWELSRATLDLLKASDAGRIINIGSVNSEYPSLGAAAYVSSKHAVYGLTKSLAMELGRYGITVNAVLPGATDTPLSRSFANFDGWLEFAVPIRLSQTPTRYSGVVPVT